MSTDQTDAKTNAFAVVHDRVHANAFFSKLAEFGIAPANQQEAMSLLKIGNELSTVDMPAPQADATDRYTKIATELQNVNATPEEQADVIKAAAYGIAQDPEIFQAAAVLLADQKSQAAG